MKTIESIGTIDNQHQIQLDEPLPIEEATRVRVVVHYELMPAEVEEQLKIARKVMAEEHNLLRRLAE
jgi:hypothetical protein